MKIKITICLLAILSVLVSACGESTGLPRSSASASTVSIDHFLLAKEDIPDDLKRLLGLGYHLPDIDEDADIEFLGASAYRIRSWAGSGRGASAAVSQIIYEFPAESGASSYLARRRVGENFHLADGMSAAFLEPEEVHLHADKAYVFCVSRPPARLPVVRCGQWGARLKYRRFIVDLVVRKYEVEKGYTIVPVKPFLTFVQRVDKHISKVLKRS